MPRLTIDNQQVEVPDGATILDAARALGIDIPTLCFRQGLAPSTSCMACVVKVNGRASLLPSCATRAEDGMAVESETDEVREARRTALELLLGDHLGDCVGPCHSLCPAQMNIPRMIRQIADGRLRDALITVKLDIPLPAVLGRICPAPCEKGCRRGDHDGPVAVCLLKRFVADADLASDAPYLPERKPPTGKRVAIVGAGPAGLAAAWFLLQEGHACTLLDDHERPGGMLRRGVPEERLSRDVVDAEIAVIQRLGAEFRTGVRVGDAVSLDELRRDFDAVLVAAGEGAAEQLGLPTGAKGVEVERHTLATPVEGVFAAGSAVRPQRMAVRAVADGKAAAASIAQFLAGRPVTGPRKLFTTRIGRLNDREIAAFMEGASDAGRVEPSAGEVGGFSDDEARAEAARCLHCDCRKPASCKLRRYAEACGASPARYKAERRPFELHGRHPEVVYEPGKCIACGLCVQTAAKAGEALGMTFIGRGFVVRVGVPFGESIAEGLAKAARECAAACPTGALALREGEE